MNPEEARLLLQRQVRKEGCTCPEIEVILATREDDGMRMVLVGHDDNCPYNLSKHLTVEMQILAAWIGQELTPDDFADEV